MQIENNHLVITLKKPTVDPEFVMNSDKEAIEKAKQQHQEKMDESVRKLAIEKKVNLLQNNGLENEDLMNLEINKMKLYKLEKSSLSCKLDQITSF